ncbi:hypothetical protein EJ110_NYTH17627 [Nymphaea thermarum]|nr:hypothetical protein EJ110_NYTH17627 [Nymphaea thermarum]
MSSLLSLTPLSVLEGLQGIGRHKGPGYCCCMGERHLLVPQTGFLGGPCCCSGDLGYLRRLHFRCPRSIGSPGEEMFCSARECLRRFLLLGTMTMTLVEYHGWKPTKFWRAQCIESMSNAKVDHKQRKVSMARIRGGSVSARGRGRGSRSTRSRNTETRSTGAGTHVENIQQQQQAFILSTLQMMTGLMQGLVQNSPSGGTSTDTNGTTNDAAKGVTHKQFMNLHPPNFHGKGTADDAEAWIRGIEKIFTTLSVPDNKKVQYGTFMVKEDAEDLWQTQCEVKFANHEATWGEFKEVFTHAYIPEFAQEQRMQEFLDLRQRNMSLHENVVKFRHLEKYCPHVYTTDASRANKFVRGLKDGLRREVMGSRPKDLDDAIHMATRFDEDSNWTHDTDKRSELLGPKSRPDMFKRRRSDRRVERKKEKVKKRSRKGVGAGNSSRLTVFGSVPRGSGAPEFTVVAHSSVCTGGPTGYWAAQGPGVLLLYGRETSPGPSNRVPRGAMLLQRRSGISQEASLQVNTQLEYVLARLAIMEDEMQVLKMQNRSLENRLAMMEEAGGVSVTPHMKVPKLRRYNGTRDMKEIEIFIYHLERCLKGSESGITGIAELKRRNLKGGGGGRGGAMGIGSRGFRGGGIGYHARSAAFALHHSLGTTRSAVSVSSLIIIVFLV